MAFFPHDDREALIAYYGDPSDPDFEAANIVRIVPPWPITYTGDDGRVTPVHSIQIHRKCSMSLQAIFNDIWDHYSRDLNNIKAVGLDNFSGSFVRRNVRGSTNISCHAFGAAIDIDAQHNEMNRAGNLGSMPMDVVAIFKKYGWFWGGDFRSRKDPMHFQAARENIVVPTPLAEDPVPPEPRDDDPAQVAEGPKPLWKSNMVRASATVGIGALGDAGYQASDVLNTAVNVKYSLTNLGVFELLSKHPSFFWMLATAALAGYIIYKKLHDNKGAQK